jgi:hypothetical protein
MKGELNMQNKKVKMTLMLDSDTISLLKMFSFKEIGETNVSKAVRILANKYARTKEEKNS